MNTAAFFKACGTSISIRVRSKSGAEYDLEKDVVECWMENDGVPNAADNPYVYGYQRSSKGPFARNTDGSVRWFFLANVEVAS